MTSIHSRNDMVRMRSYNGKTRILMKQYDLGYVGE